MTMNANGWLPDTSSSLIPKLLTAHSNQRLAELALFARVVAKSGDADSKRCIEDAMRFARAVPSQVLASVALEPEFDYWSYIARCLRGRLENNEAVPLVDVPHLSRVKGYSSNPLLMHVLELNRFLLGAALLAGCKAQLLLPVHEAKVVIPSLGMILSAPPSSSTVAVDLDWNTGAQLTVDGRLITGFVVALEAAKRRSGAHSGMDVRVMPWVRIGLGAFVVNGQDPYYRYAWITSYLNADGTRYQEIPLDEYSRWERNLRDAASVLAECWPEMEQDIGQGLRAVIPVRSPTKGIHMSCSKDVMGFAVVMSEGDPIVLAEAIIHEFGHNVLNSIIGVDDVLAEPQRVQADLYSPWRPDARPLGAVLHAVYVFERICEFYLRYMALHENKELGRLRHRFSLMTIRNLIGVETLQSVNVGLGSLGLKILEMLRARVTNHASRLMASDWQRASGELVAHYHKWLQCNELPHETRSETLSRLISVNS